MTALELAKKVAALLDSKKAKDVEAIDINGLTTIGDYFVVASGSSTSQTKALADEVEEKLSQLGVEPKRVEGYNSAAWILLDYSDVIVHVFLEEAREFYSLDRLWADAPRVDLSDVLTQD